MGVLILLCLILVPSLVVSIIVGKMLKRARLYNERRADYLDTLDHDQRVEYLLNEQHTTTRAIGGLVLYDTIRGINHDNGTG